MQATAVMFIIAIIFAILIYDYFEGVIKFRKANKPKTIIRYKTKGKTRTGIVVSRKWHTAEVRDTIDRKIHKINDYQIQES